MRLQTFSEFKVYRYSLGIKKPREYSIKIGEFKEEYVECYNKIFGTEFSIIDLSKKGRNRKRIEFRYIYWMLLTSHRGMRQLEIAKLYRYNHATVYYGVTTIEGRLRVYKELNKMVASLRSCLIYKKIL